MTLRLVENGAQVPLNSSEPGLDEFEGARLIAEQLEAIGSRMPLDSEQRALALRSARRWGVFWATRPLGYGKRGD